MGTKWTIATCTTCAEHGCEHAYCPYMKWSFYSLQDYRSVRCKQVPKTHFPVQSSSNDWESAKLFTTLKQGCTVIMGFCTKEPLSLLMGITVGFIGKN